MHSPLRLKMSCARRMSFPEAVAKVERSPRLATESCDTHEKENADDNEFVPDSEGEPDEPREEPQQHSSGLLGRNESKREREESDDEAEINARVLRPRQDCASAIMCRSAPIRSKLVSGSHTYKKRK